MANGSGLTDAEVDEAPLKGARDVQKRVALPVRVVGSAITNYATEQATHHWHWHWHWPPALALALALALAFPQPRLSHLHLHSRTAYSTFMST